MQIKPPLTIDTLLAAAAKLAGAERDHGDPALYGVTDGKAVGTYFEVKFKSYLSARYEFTQGSTAKGIDFPGLRVDMKVTSSRQPQSSCPFRSPRQKIFGLGYSILVFVYDKTDDHQTQTGHMDIQHVVFIEEHRTADYQTTSRIKKIIENEGNIDDLLGLMEDILLPVDDIMARQLAEEILRKPPEVGYLTVSNALQWRLQYSRVITQAGLVEGILKVL